MAATVYTEQRDYVKFNQHEHGHKHESGCGCEKCSSSEDCSCCPKGLIALYDDAGRHLGCVTPNDAELYEKNTHICEEGFVKLIRNSDGVFLGCVNEDNFEALYDKVNGDNS